MVCLVFLVSFSRNRRKVGEMKNEKENVRKNGMTFDKHL
jgi:hypothetical protein